ncbi:kinase-like domain-containing protein [Protomyces lactucae-debilis]|uniref:[RNA-polymerase]-subunit kinase n=1 Tax=Protomyces lactucae-debilis TaxID=2754530 RepID=A0A1Y2FLS6_PROLT|nr:kinase-like domain-containing protein [Protomyces lactucae-debilis]ORY84908.1 kinase-like domain-containing protein [Protomyces lactucae-debilis]
MPAAVAKYQKLNKLGEGTYAVVWAGKELATGRQIAIKKIKVGQFKEGLDMSAIREVKFLREVKHENVIELIDIYSNKQNLNLILEYLEADLEHLIKDRSILFSTGDVKSWMLMTLRGLHHLHARFILHRDLKPNNLLLSTTGVLKLADFGLAKDFGAAFVNMSPNVVTRWYRAPELFLGAKQYGPGIDMWAVGCIFAELLLRNPYMPGENDMGQLDLIFKALGTPSKQDWPDVIHLPQYVEFRKHERPDPRQLFTAASEQEIDLMQQMLTLDPLKRPTTTDALRHPYFKALPRPTPPEQLPKRGGGLDKVSADLKRKPGNLDTPDRSDGASKVARKLF